MKKEFKRCRPESAGISSREVFKLIDHLEEDYSEIHSLMIMRHDQIAAEGWWQPYSPAVRHEMMSASKTFSGTAIALAIQEGITSMDEKISEIFPEYIPDHANENLMNITVRDLLCMGSGSEPVLPVNQNWPMNYFNDAEFKYEPGTHFLYNNAAATLLALIIKKRTGQNLPEFLKERLFEKIGIAYDNVTWFSGPDGTNFAPGGLHCTTEDLLRLMRLYLHNGSWDGEQILDEEYVRLATSKRIDSSNIFGYAQTDRFSDNVFGYGYMMWISHDDMGYRAEGGYGQFGIVIPKLDMIIAITQTSGESPVSQTTLDYIWQFAETVQEEPLPEDPEAYRLLENRLSRLSVKRDPVNPHGTFPHPGVTYRTESKGIAPYVLFFDPIKAHEEVRTMTGISEFSFQTDEDNPYHVRMHCLINGNAYHLNIPTDGSRAHHMIPEMIYASEVLLSGYWQDENTFSVRFRWYETCFTRELSFRFTENGCTLSADMIHGEDRDPLKETEYRF